MFDVTHPLYREDLAGTLPYIETANLAGKSILITGAGGAYRLLFGGRIGVF